MAFPGRQVLRSVTGTLTLALPFVPSPQTARVERRLGGQSPRTASDGSRGSRSVRKGVGVLLYFGLGFSLSPKTMKLSFDKPKNVF